MTFGFYIKYSVLPTITSLIIPLSVAFANDQLVECGGYKDAIRPYIIEREYKEARKIILKNGWTPVETRKSKVDLLPDNDHDSDGFGFNGAINIWKNGYIEIEMCSINGICQFKFIDKKHRILYITTSGENDLFVTNYSINCETTQKI